MFYEITITPFAEHDLKEAVEFYNGRKSGLGYDLVDEIDGVIKRIESNPRMFPLVTDKTRKAVLKRFPYNIYFVIVDSRIFVTAIFNTWRKPKLWKGRRL